MRNRQSVKNEQRGVERERERGSMSGKQIPAELLCVNEQRT